VYETFFVLFLPASDPCLFEVPFKGHRAGLGSALKIVPSTGKMTGMKRLYNMMIILYDMIIMLYDNEKR
jgi:hypothetical protein